MKYKINPIHIHQLEIPILPVGDFIDGTLSNVIHKYPVNKEKNIHPFRIDWKYRVFLNKAHLFSYLGEVQFLIEDDGVDFAKKNFDMFIANLYINFEIGWQDRTKRTPLDGTTVPSLRPDNVNAIQELIVKLMKE
jgi:hypothetical protein